VSSETRAPMIAILRGRDMRVLDASRSRPARITVRPPLVGSPCAATPARLAGRQRRGRRPG
jgi:hypothetical protein